MPQRLDNYCSCLLGILGLLALSAPVLAHPGHGQISSAPVPTWRMEDGTVVSAYLMKAEHGLVWLVDESNQTLVVPVADLDDAGQQAVRRTTSRLRILNGEPARRATDAALAMAFTSLLVPDAPAAPTPEAAKAFRPFDRVKTRWDDKYLYVESNGLPDHPMMKGIRAWQQQVPLPQPYTGDNAWRIPLNPVPAKSPAMARPAEAGLDGPHRSVARTRWP